MKEKETLVAKYYKNCSHRAIQHPFDTRYYWSALALLHKTLKSIVHDR